MAMVWEILGVIARLWGGPAFERFETGDGDTASGRPIDWVAY